MQQFHPKKETNPVKLNKTRLKGLQHFKARELATAKDSPGYSSMLISPAPSVKRIIFFRGAATLRGQIARKSNIRGFSMT